MLNHSFPTCAIVGFLFVFVLFWGGCFFAFFFFFQKWILEDGEVGKQILRQTDLSIGLGK